MNMRLIEGQVENDAETQIEALREELRDVRAALSAATREARQAREESSRALGALRRQLMPLYRALQAVFGEIDAAGIVDDGTAGTSAAANPRTAAVWESWKSRLGGSCSRAIDALLLHGEMNTTQLAIAMGCNRNTIPNVIFKLNKAGLINKNGGRFSLKTL